MNQYMEKLYPRSLIHLTRHLQGLIQGKLWLKILISMFLGLVVGLILSPHTGLVSPKAAEVFGSWLALPGNIFLGLIQMIVIPLILASIIRGMAASEDLEHLRQLGLRLVFYLTITTIVAITIGIGVTTVLQPGQFIDQSLVTSVVETAPAESQEGITETPELEAFPDIVISLFPENPLGSMMRRCCRLSSFH